MRRSPKPSAGKPVPTQPVRPTTRKQKEYGLKAYYPSKCEGMELKILEQPEAQHRARYQTEGSRGAIKDVSQQGFPVIKVNLPHLLKLDKYFLKLIKKIIVIESLFFSLYKLLKIDLLTCCILQALHHPPKAKELNSIGI